MRTTLFLVVLTLMGTALANPQKPPQPRRGSYWDSCMEWSLSGNVLKAKCRTFSFRIRDDDYYETSLSNYSDCKGDIANEEGNLVCKPYPWGHYVNSCDHISVSGDVLNAKCLNRNGKRVDASLDGFRKCRTYIDNSDGMLDCEMQR